MEMDQKLFEKMLLPPTGEIDAVLDTDAYNEIDDQFAISYLLKYAPRIRTRAIFAAPFLNERSTSPEDGMERSYREILRLLKLCNREDMLPDVYLGSKTYLEDEASPVESPAAERLIELSREYTSEKPLYVVAIGAITNVASALLLDASMAERIVLVWLGGHGRMWPDTKEFNLWQDVAAARVVFDSDVPLIQLPCHHHRTRAALSPLGEKSPCRLSGAERAGLLSRQQLPLVESDLGRHRRGLAHRCPPLSDVGDCPSQTSHLRRPLRDGRGSADGLRLPRASGQIDERSLR